MLFSFKDTTKKISLRQAFLLTVLSWLSVALNEGKNREVRRVLEHFGLKVNRLIRVSYGPFQLGKLPQGESRKVPDKVIKEQIGAIKNVIDLSDKHNKV